MTQRKVPQRAQPESPQNGFAIRDFRICRGLTVDELANRVGISGPHMRNLELENRNASDVDLNKIAHALDVRVSSLRRRSRAESEALPA